MSFCSVKSKVPLKKQAGPMKSKRKATPEPQSDDEMEAEEDEQETNDETGADQEDITAVSGEETSNDEDDSGSE